MKWEKLEINTILIFECNFSERKFVFPHLEVVEAETANVERYVRVLEAGEGEQSVLPFLRWLISNMALPGDSLLVK
ncbi:MAG TPA: ATP-binding protein, partial [Candidatus Eisenbergiella pullistercoris]|nr:ATP-binding protein [Candidatus Eisenbergiella pullistercoris]